MERNTHTIDAKGISLGRVATQVAHLLMGKHKPSYVAYRDLGDRVIVSNLKLIKFTGNKLEQKKYYRPTTRVGALKSETLASLWKRRPQEVMRKAVMGMLPKNSLRKEMIKRLTIKDAQ
jgi:large subunit ribosomal protein L13